MTEADCHSDEPSRESGSSQRADGRTELTPMAQRRVVLRRMATVFVVVLIWCLTMFWSRRPALDYFCISGLIPLVLASTWLVLAGQLLSLLWKYPELRRPWLKVVLLIAIFLAPYSLLRAGSDMFTLSLRYELWRAGGAEKVQIAFNKWVASQPVYHPSDGRKWLFCRFSQDGSAVPLPAEQLPAEVRYINDRFPSRFGLAENDVAYLDNVSVLTTTEIMIGPPGWKPEGGATFWNHVTGDRRELEDGIWVEFGFYDK